MRSCFVFARTLSSTIMSDTSPLKPASPDEVEQALAYALRYDGRKRMQRGDELMARLVAEHLMQHLELSGFVVMKKPPVAPPRAG